jgi:YqaJ-like viral recombinase domain
MINKNRITNLKISTPEWNQFRLGRFTSSQIYKICGEKGFGELGNGYIRTRYFEQKSGISTDQEILNESVVHGNVNEPVALRRLAAKYGFEFLATQLAVEGEDSRFSSTPDALIMSANLDGINYELETIEVKCFQPDRHIECAMCETPQDVKSVDKKTYWQVLHQMQICHALRGYLVYFHPDLPENEAGLNVIEFRKAQQINGKFNILEDMKFLILRQKLALEELEKIETKFLHGNK